MSLPKSTPSIFDVEISNVRILNVRINVHFSISYNQQRFEFRTLTGPHYCMLIFFKLLDNFMRANLRAFRRRFNLNFYCLTQC